MINKFVPQHSLQEPSVDRWHEEVTLALGLVDARFSDTTAQTIFYPDEQYLYALDFMYRVLCSRVAAGVLIAVKGGGKSTLVRRFLSTLDKRVRVACVQPSSALSPHDFLQTMLRQWHIPVSMHTGGGTVCVALERNVRHGVAQGRIYLLIVENAQALHPDVLEELRYLATMESSGERQIKLLLLGQPALNWVLDSPRMQALLPPDALRFVLTPFNEEQVAAYVKFRLSANGVENPEHIIPHTLMTSIYRITGGVPGEINKLCESALIEATLQRSSVVTAQCVLAAARSLNMPVTAHESLLKERQCNLAAVTPVGKAALQVCMPDGTEQVFVLTAPRTVLGRSDRADITLNNAFISRYHALIVREPDKDLLINLGSMNGVQVNSRQVMRCVLQHQDLISLGSIKITYLNPVAEMASEQMTVAIADLDQVELERTQFGIEHFLEMETLAQSELS